MRVAAQRIAPRADDKDHQHLGRNRFNKPASAKQRLVRVEEPQQQIESQKVKERTDRADGQHEVADKSHVPALRSHQVFVIDIVQWQRDFGYVVEQVVEQDLQRQHRQKRQKQRGGGHAEHVAEVRTGGHHDVLHHVAKSAPPFQDALVQHHQVFFQQDHGSGLLGHIDRTIDRDANIGCVQRGRVVDTVAQIANDMAACFQCQDDAILLRRVDAAEQVHTLDPRAQRVVVHGRHFGAGQHAVNRHAKFGADMARHALVVAGHDLHCHTTGGHRAQCASGAGLGWIEKSSKTGKHQLTLVRHHGMWMVQRHIAPGDAQRPKALLTQAVEQRVNAFAC